MNNKLKNILILIIAVLITAIATYFITVEIKKPKVDKTIKDVIESVKKASENNKIELKKYTGDIPKFTLVIRGLYTGSVTELDVKEKNIDVYEFEGNLNYSWGNLISKYVGIRVKDILEKMDITEFNEILIESFEENTIKFKKDEISDNAFIVLYRDNEPIRNYDANYIDFDYLGNLSIEGISKIVFQ